MHSPAPPVSHDRDRIAEAERWLSEALPSTPGIVIFVGVGLGHAVDVLEQRHPAARAIVIEPNPDVATAMRTRRDWTPLIDSRRLAVVVGPDYAGLNEIARRFPDLGDAPTLTYPPLQRENPDAVAKAMEAVKRLQFSAKANGDARKASAGRYLLHTLSNAPRIAREGNAATLAGLFTGVPAVIAAAGPSLDTNIHDMAPVRDRAIIIACDTAARPLMTSGLVPDFIVASDPSRANAAHLSSLPPAPSWLVAEGSLHPSAFVHFDRRTFVFNVSAHEPWPWLTSIGLERGRVETWGSVATSAFSLAVMMGCNPIVLIGADFAFTNGRPYCRGTSFEPMWGAWIGGGTRYEDIWQAAIDRWPRTESLDLHGQPARTAPHLVSFRDWIVDRTGLLGDRTVINATGGGILWGTSIQQQSATPALVNRARLDSAPIHASIRRAHAAGRAENAARLFEAIDNVMGQSSKHADAWMAFGGDTVTQNVIESALRSPEYLAWALARGRMTAAQQETL